MEPWGGEASIRRSFVAPFAPCSNSRTGGFAEGDRNACSVEPICAVLPSAPATYYEHSARRRDPELRPERARREEQQLYPETQRDLAQRPPREVWINNGKRARASR